MRNHPATPGPQGPSGFDHHADALRVSPGCGPVAQDKNGYATPMPPAQEPLTTVGDLDRALEKRGCTVSFSNATPSSPGHPGYWGFNSTDPKDSYTLFSAPRSPTWELTLEAPVLDFGALGVPILPVHQARIRDWFALIDRAAASQAPSFTGTSAPTTEDPDAEPESFLGPEPGPDEVLRVDLLIRGGTREQAQRIAAMIDPVLQDIVQRVTGLPVEGELRPASLTRPSVRDLIGGIRRHPDSDAIRQERNARRMSQAEMFAEFDKLLIRALRTPRF